MTSHDMKMMEKLEERLNWFLNGNQEAIRFCMVMYAFCQVWDDMIDRDSPLPGEDEFNYITFSTIMILLTNEFARNHAGIISSNLITIFLRWQDANKLEKTGSERDMRLSWMNRFSLVDLFHLCAFLACGPEWVTENGYTFRQMLDEDYEEFMKTGR